MRNIFYISIMIFYILSISVFAQAPRSEIIKYVSSNTIKGNNLIRIDSCVLQINERMGDHDAEINIAYSKGDKLSIESAWIEDRQGNIVRKLKKGDIKDRSYVSNAALYEDDFIKTFELKHNNYPYRIHYSFKVTYSKYLYAIGINHIKTKTPIRRKEVILETDFDHPVNYRQKNVDNPVIDTIGSMIKYKWLYNYSPSQHPETNSSVNTSDAPLIEAVPLNFKYGNKGKWDTWIDFGNWVYSLNKGRNELPNTEKSTIDRLIVNAKNDEEKVKILYKYLQDYTRYILVNINIGGFQSYPASYVCANRYGDCKALTNYMQAMLKYIGIQSYYTLINAGDQIEDIDMNFPSQAFNHVILTVPLANDTVFLECTSKNNPFGYMGTFTQGRKALMVIQDGSRFVDIPPLVAEDVLCTRNILVNLDTSELEFTTENRGYKYEYYMDLASNANQNYIDKYIRNNIMSGSYDLLSYEFINTKKESPSIQLKARCKAHSTHKKYGNNIIINPYPIYIPYYETPEKRISDVEVHYPEYYKDSIILEIGDIKVNKIAEPVSIESEYGAYELKYELKENKVIIYKSILINAGRYTKEQYPGFYKFMLSIRNNENKNFYLETL